MSQRREARYDHWRRPRAQTGSQHAHYTRPVNNSRRPSSQRGSSLQDVVTENWSDERRQRIPVRRISIHSESPKPRSALSQTHQPRRFTFLVCGSTGAGKSTFIRKLLMNDSSGPSLPRRGHSLAPCTSAYKCFSYVTPLGEEVSLVDTPGFDDSRFTDAENLAKLARFLQSLEKLGQRIDGLIFINPIIDVRLRSSLLKMNEVIKHICGKQFFGHVALVTSMWDLVESKHVDAAKQRQALMLESPRFWRDLCSGDNVFPFRNSIESANRVIQYLLTRARAVAFNEPSLQMAQELRKGCLLSQTSAGAFLLGELTKERQKHIQAVEELRREISKARRSGDKESADEAAEEVRDEVSQARKIDSETDLLHGTFIACR